MSNLVGIDLGTTYSAIARLDDTGRPVIIDNKDGDNITPSIVLSGELSPPIASIAIEIFLIIKEY